MSESSDPDDAWHGWGWVEGQWQRLCTAGTIRACAKLLGGEAHRRGLPNRQTCLTTGAAPDYTPRED